MWPAVSAEPVALLLAAGRGRRFGADKRWQVVDGVPMALASARAVLAAVPRVVAVVRAEDSALAGALAELGCHPVTCPDADRGMGLSLAAGVQASIDAAGWLVALADMPWVQPATHAAVLGALTAGASVARACHGGRAGHPVGFDRRWRDALLALDGDEGARRIVQRAGPALVHCEVGDPGCLRDVDRPMDLGRGAFSDAGPVCS